MSLDLVRDDARLSQRQLCLIWMNIRNAFGSVDHEVLYLTLVAFGLSTLFIKILKTAYTDCNLQYFDGFKESVIKKVIGLKLGYPISPIF